MTSRSAPASRIASAASSHRPSTRASGSDAASGRGRAPSAELHPVFHELLRRRHPDEQPSALLDRDAHGGVSVPTDPQRKTLALERSRIHADRWDLPEPSVVAEGRLAPCETKDLDRLHHARVVDIGRLPASLRLLHQPHTPDAALDTSF